MKLTAPQGALAAVTGWVTATTRIGKTATVSPALCGLLITAAEDGTVTITGADLDVTATTRLSAEVGEPGRALIPARLLAEATRMLPAQPVTLALDGSRVRITAGPVTYHLPALAAEHYPTPPEVGAPVAEFDTAALAAAVAQAATAASGDDTLPALTGIQLTLGDGTATLAATDRYRLAVATCPCTPLAGYDDTPTQILISARDLTTITRHPGAAAISLSVSADGAVAAFTTADRHVTVRLLGAEFPQYDKLIPAEHDTTVIASLTELTSAVRRAAVITDKHASVKLSFTTGQALIESGAGDEASLAETIAVTTSGEPQQIAFNPGYLASALTAIAATGSTAVTIALTTPVAPAVLTPAEPAGPVSCTHLLMPIRLSG
jgi:DNA polymerase-3 subunit beta